MATPPKEPRSSSLSHVERIEPIQETPEVRLSLSAPPEEPTKKKTKGGGVGRILKRGKRPGSDLAAPQEIQVPTVEAPRSPRKKSMSKFLPKRSVSPSSPFPGVSLHNDHAPPPVFVQKDRSELSNFLIGNGTRQPMVGPLSSQATLSLAHAQARLPVYHALHSLFSL